MGELHTRPTWEEYFTSQVQLLATRSTCTRLSVGALIVRGNRIIASGYNGSVRGDDHCYDEGCYMVDKHCIRTVHAEVNALLQCAKYGVSTDGSEIYVTHFPCKNCTKAIIQAGVKKVHYIDAYGDMDYATELLKQSGVGLHQVAQ